MTTNLHSLPFGSDNIVLSEGCDASILLDHEGREKTANVSKSLRGFEVIKDINAEIEKKCPKTVSCADILTVVARDVTVLANGPYWTVPYGRKEGQVSLASDVVTVPKGRADPESKNIPGLGAKKKKRAPLKKLTY
ncbi:hypothetical protein R6Q57_010703 [Mikania cordata]